MTRPNRIRRIGWLAALSIAIGLYMLLHLKVNAVHSDVVQAEREIVRLEERNMLLETEFLTRSNQVQLTRLNRINFGFSAPTASQYLDNTRQLARFSVPRAEDAPAPIRVAGMNSNDGLTPFPQLAALDEAGLEGPQTGQPNDEDEIELSQAQQANGQQIEEARLAVTLRNAPQNVRIEIAPATEAPASDENQAGGPLSQ